MKTLTNLMGSHVTGDEIANAVLAYHEALVARRSVGLVEIPVVGEERPARRATFAVGWLTGLVAASGPKAGRRAERSVEDAALVSDLHALALATLAL